MATVYLHIGAPKTATSTLQNVFARNARRLLKRGVLYPQSIQTSDAHHVLACDLIEKCQGSQMSDVWYGSQPRGQAWQSLQCEIEDHGNAIDTVVLSTELFFGQTRRLSSILEEIARSLQDHEVKVVVYLRRQDQLYSSFYNQDVKGMRQWSESAYAFYETHQIFQTSYYDLLGMWSEIFGKDNMIVRPFEPGQWPGGDIVQDFCAAIGIKPLSSKYRDQNESLGGTQLYLKRCLNKIGFEKQLNDRVVDILNRLCPEEPAGPCFHVHRGLYMKYRKDWQKVNRLLSADYLQGEALFKEGIPEPGQIEIYQVDRDAVARSIGILVAAFESGEHGEHRELFAKAALLAIAEQDLWQALPAASHTQLLQWV